MGDEPAKATVPSLGGTAAAATATHHWVPRVVPSRSMENRPQMVSDAIRDDLVDGINQFTSQVTALQNSPHAPHTMMTR